RDRIARRRQDSTDGRLRNRLVDVERPAPDVCRRHLPGVVGIPVRRSQRWPGNRELVDLPGAERGVGIRRGHDQLELGAVRRWRWLHEPADPAHHREPVEAVRCFPAALTTGCRSAMNQARLVYATALSAMIGWGLIAPQPAQAQLSSLIVTITSPADGSPVSGTIPVTASVTIVGSLTVAGVQFKLDGNNLGAEDTSAPYSVSWNTTTASNGSHTLTAVAREGLLGTLWTSDPVAVTVSNDITRPTVTINQAASQADPTSTSPINFTAAFSEPVSGFTGTDVTLSGTAGGTKTATVSGGPSTYNVAVSGMSSSGTVLASIPAGV